MRTLAEPSLTAISGETATFSVGGEYHVADGKDDTADGVEFEFRTISYGVSLSFTPVFCPPVVSACVSAPRYRNRPRKVPFVIPRASAGSSSAPGVRRRQAETTVELPSGGSMVLAGLLKDDVRQTSAGFPGLRSVPVLGTLFRSREFQRYESELVVIATPYLVRPTARHKLARPDDNFMPAGDGAPTSWAG